MANEFGAWSNNRLSRPTIDGVPRLPLCPKLLGTTLQPLARHEHKHPRAANASGRTTEHSYGSQGHGHMCVCASSNNVVGDGLGRKHSSRQGKRLFHRAPRRQDKRKLFHDRPIKNRRRSLLRRLVVAEAAYVCAPPCPRRWAPTQPMHTRMHAARACPQTSPLGNT